MLKIRKLPHLGQLGDHEEMCAQLNRFRDETRNSTRERAKASFILSQLILFQSRKKWGIVYALATLVGFLCVPNSGLLHSGVEMKNVSGVASSGVLLAAASFVIIIGMYVLNDVVDAELDRSNGKKRPIPIGQVSKRDAWAFIILTNVIGMLLASITFNLASIIVSLMIVSIGLMYSAPKVALKDRFVLKTLSIAIAMMLCAILGSSAYWDIKYIHDNTNMNSLVMPAYVVLMLGTMIFITSPVSDAADVTGDALAGRSTIPIVIGRENTLKMAILLCVSMSVVSWLLFSLHHIGMIMTTSVSIISMATMIQMIRSLRRLYDTEFVLDPRKNTMPLHILLQLALIAGAFLFQP